MPSALSIPMNMPKYNWFYHTEPEPQLNGRRMHTPRGKVLGGSSSINGLVYIRGNPQDFERWQAQGARGWGYRDVLPYFQAAPRQRAEGGDRVPRRQPASCAPATARCRNPLHAAWLAAAREAGYPSHGRCERLSAGRLWPHGHDRGRRAALQRGECLPAAGHAPPQSQGADACAGDAHRVRWPARRRRANIRHGGASATARGSARE